MPYKHNSSNTQLAKQLRRDMTKEERHLWFDFLCSYPLKFYRQRPIGPYIVDFYCAKAKLVIELDGSQHFDPSELLYDEKRTEYLETQHALFVLRIPNNEINSNFRGVCEYIDHIIKHRTNMPPLLRGGG